MKLVTQERFTEVISELDCHPYPTGKYPYTAIFRTRDGAEVGRIVSVCETPGQPWPVIDHHYLANHLAGGE